MKWSRFLLVLLAGAPSLHADIVHMKDGRVLQGVIVDVNKDSVTLQKGISGSRIFSVLPRSGISAIRLGPTKMGTERRRALRYMNEKKFEAALRTWKYINALEPDHVENRLGLAKALRLTGNLEEARGVASAAFQLSSEDSRVPLELAEIALASGDTSTAILQAREAGPSGYQLLARAFRAAGRPEEATRVLLDAFEAGSGNTGCFQDLIEQREFQVAEKIARERVARKPRERKGWLLLGQVLHASGNYGEAIPVFRKAITLGGPGFDRARVFLLVSEAREEGNAPLSKVRESDHVLARELEPELRRDDP